MEVYQMQSREVLQNLIAKEYPGQSSIITNKWIDCLEQLKDCHVHSFVAQATDETAWLNARKIGIGGSEIACVAGKSPWSSPRDIYFKKTGQFEEEGNQNESARWGNLLEDTVANEWAARNNKEIVKIPVSIRSDIDPIRLANIDGFVLADDGYTIYSILEIKTTSVYNLDAWLEGPLPEYYICQATWYAGITGVGRIILACLVGGQRLLYTEMIMLKSLYDELSDAAHTFWHENVLKLIEPPLTDGDFEKMKKHSGDVIESGDVAEALVLDDDEADTVVEAFLIAKANEAAYKKLKEGLQAKIFGLLGDSIEAVTHSRSINLSSYYRASVDSKKLKKFFPLAYEECANSSLVVKMNIK